MTFYNVWRKEFVGLLSYGATLVVIWLGVAIGLTVISIPLITHEYISEPFFGIRPFHNEEGTPPLSFVESTAWVFIGYLAPVVPAAVLMIPLCSLVALALAWDPDEYSHRRPPLEGNDPN
jgi:hypothetical protein